MRYIGIIIVGFLVLSSLDSCKSSSVSGKSAPSDYEEDLTYLRPELDDDEEESNVETFSERNVTVNYVNHIGEELDSVNRIIVTKNREARYEDGYTIQIYTGNDRQAANEARERALEINPELDPVISYHQPGYKVKVGQYLDRLRAHQIYESLKKEFPLALLIPERIQVDYD